MKTIIKSIARNSSLFAMFLTCNMTYAQTQAATATGLIEGTKLEFTFDLVPQMVGRDHSGKEFHRLIKKDKRIHELNDVGHISCDLKKAKMLGGKLKGTNTTETPFWGFFNFPKLQKCKELLSVLENFKQGTIQITVQTAPPPTICEVEYTGFFGFGREEECYQQPGNAAGDIIEIKYIDL